MSQAVSLFTLEEVAEELRCSVRTVRKLIHGGRLPAFQLHSGNGRYLVRESDLERFVRKTATGRRTRSAVKASADASSGDDGS